MLGLGCNWSGFRRRCPVIDRGARFVKNEKHNLNQRGDIRPCGYSGCHCATLLTDESPTSPAINAAFFLPAVLLAGIAGEQNAEARPPRDSRSHRR